MPGRPPAEWSLDCSRGHRWKEVRRPAGKEMVVAGGDELAERGLGGLSPGPWCVVYRESAWRMVP